MENMWIAPSSDANDASTVKIGSRKRSRSEQEQEEPRCEHTLNFHKSEDNDEKVPKKIKQRDYSSSSSSSSSSSNDDDNACHQQLQPRGTIEEQINPSNTVGADIIDVARSNSISSSSMDVDANAAMHISHVEEQKLFGTASMKETYNATVVVAEPFFGDDGMGSSNGGGIAVRNVGTSKMIHPILQTWKGVNNYPLEKKDQHPHPLDEKIITRKDDNTRKVGTRTYDMMHYQNIKQPKQQQKQKQQPEDQNLHAAATATATAAMEDIYMDHEIDDYHGGGKDSYSIDKPCVLHKKSKFRHVKEIIGLSTMFIANTLFTIWLLGTFFSTASCSSLPSPRQHTHVIPPSQTSYYTYVNRINLILPTLRHLGHNSIANDASCQILSTKDALSNVTLRQFLSHPDGFHLGIAPAFFGFYVYFGALIAFSENVLTEKEKQQGKILLPNNGGNPMIIKTPLFELESQLQPQPQPQQSLLKSVAGASAGAMAAVLVAAGLNPRDSADFVSALSVDKFWDFPGFGGILKGELFEELMIERLKESVVLGGGGGDNTAIKLEDALIPVAVTAFDIFNFQNIVLTKGCMGKAARASATFPGLFQPCAWVDDDDDSRYLIDGGVWDMYGLEGLGHSSLGDEEQKNKRIVNLVAGSFGNHGPPGPSKMTMLRGGAKEVVSLSIENTPRCGPWAMENGPKAVEAAMNAIISVLDVPMYQGDEEGHYVLHVDATAFVPF